VNRCAPRIVGNEQPELRAILGGTLDNMSTEIPKSKRLKQPFSKMDELLTARGYTKQKASGLFYWLWRLPNEFPLYCFNGKLGANKIFIDATFVDLAKVLSSVKGIVPPSGGTTKNHKFEVFQFKRVNPYRGTTEYEGWKFVFRDSDAAAKFLDICEAFAREGLDAAQQVACQFEQIPSPKTDKKGPNRSPNRAAGFSEAVVEILEDVCRDGLHGFRTSKGFPYQTLVDCRLK
jgi:hypothetical protein